MLTAQCGRYTSSSSIDMLSPLLGITCFPALQSHHHHHRVYTAGDAWRKHARPARRYTKPKPPPRCNLGFPAATLKPSPGCAHAEEQGHLTDPVIHPFYPLSPAIRAKLRREVASQARDGNGDRRDHRRPPPALRGGVARGHVRAPALPHHRRAHARLAPALPRRHQHTVRRPRADLQRPSLCDDLGVHSSHRRSHTGVHDDPDEPPGAEDGAHAGAPGGLHPGGVRHLRGLQVPQRGRGAGPGEPPLVDRHRRHLPLRAAVAHRLRRLLDARHARAHARRRRARARRRRAGHLPPGRVRRADGARPEERQRHARHRGQAHQRHRPLHRLLRGLRRRHSHAAHRHAVPVARAVALFSGGLRPPIDAGRWVGVRICLIGWVSFTICVRLVHVYVYM